MARHKACDIENAVEKATQLFWQRGYEQTSLDDLLEHLDIGRGSFYNAFGDKRKLFMAALEHYQRLTNDVIIIDTLHQSESGLVGINRVFERIVEDLSNDPDHRGCLLINTTIELAPKDDEISGFLRDSAHRNEDAFYDALVRAQKADEISPDIEPRAMARFLLNTIRCMRVTGRITHEHTLFTEIARIALASLHL